MTTLPKRIRASIALLLTAVMAVAGQPAFAATTFSPPPGMSLTTGRPTNGLALSVPRRVHLDPKFMRQVVPFETEEAAGTIIVKTGEKFLYLVLGGGKAMRYGIGTAKDGFEWSGTHRTPTSGNGPTGHRRPR